MYLTKKGVCIKWRLVAFAQKMEPCNEYNVNFQMFSLKENDVIVAY